MSESKKKYVSTKRPKYRKSSMPLLLTLGGLLVLVAAVLVIWRDGSTRGSSGTGATGPEVPVEVSGAPSLKVDKEKVDLGTVKLGQPVQVSFQVANAGDEPLRLTKEPYVEVVEGC